MREWVRLDIYGGNYGTETSSHSESIKNILKDVDDNALVMFPSIEPTDPDEVTDIFVANAAAILKSNLPGFDRFLYLTNLGDNSNIAEQLQYSELNYVAKCEEVLYG